MKNKIRLIMSAMLAVCVMLSMSAAAYADFTSSFTTNQTVSKIEVYKTDAVIKNATISSGTLPSGFSLSKDEHRIYLSGTSTKTGSYECGIWVETDKGLDASIIKLTISEPAGKTDEFLIPTVSASPTATPAPVQTNTPPKITKHPTGETVEPGGTAKFIARADNVTDFVWRIVSKDTTNTIPAKDAPSYFGGLKVSGTDSETLVLSNIPASMDGWSVECKFINANGNSFTNGAVITVKSKQPVVTTPKPTAKNPVINTQPVDEKCDLGTPCTLSVKAISPDNGMLYYQWYKSANGNSSNITAIENANDASYTPPETEGTVYYCVAISNAKDGKESPAIYSNMVSVTYTNPTVPMQSAEPSAQPTDGSFGDTPTASPTATARPVDGSSSNDSGSSQRATILFFGITGALAFMALVGILAYLLKSGKEK